jgi:hypothetical protein
MKEYLHQKNFPNKVSIHIYYFLKQLKDQLDRGWNQMQ